MGTLIYTQMNNSISERRDHIFRCTQLFEDLFNKMHSIMSFLFGIKTTEAFFEGSSGNGSVSERSHLEWSECKFQSISCRRNV